MSDATIEILLVEDNPADVALLRAALAEASRDHFGLTVAARVGEAIALSEQRRFDVILLDLGLPDSHGIETLTRIRRSLAAVPVVVLTGLADEALAVQTLQQGAQDYLVKDEAPGPVLRRAIRYAIERKAAEELAHVRETELAHLSRLSTVGHMAGGLAHELNQPLGAILNYAGVCLNQLQSSEGGSRATALSALEELMNETRRAGAIISRLRSFLRKQKPQSAAVDINDLVQQSVELMAFELRHQVIHPHLRLADTPRVWADPVQIEQVLVNLIYNALEAMDGGDCPRKDLTIETVLKPAGRTVEVRVTDTGCGVTPEQLGRLFEAFFTTKPTGVGMGLNISRTIIESHGGRLTASVNPSGGMSFAFTLPLAEGDAS